MDDVDYPPAVAAMIGVLAWFVAVATVTLASMVAIQPSARTCLSASANPARTSVVERFGRQIRSTLRQPASSRHDRAIGVAIVLVLVLGTIDPRLAAIAAFAAWARSVLKRRRAAQRDAERVGAALADVIDLFAVALLSGDTVGDAVRQVGAWADDHIAAAFLWCDRQAKAGRSLGDALEELPDRLGSQVRPLVAALVATERYGAPITASLAQLAVDTRADRRRRAEASARRLPVLLLFPLVTCVLPAFLLVTVVPVIFETVSNFDFSASP